MQSEIVAHYRCALRAEAVVAQEQARRAERRTRTQRAKRGARSG
jgi:hypothetical protein